MLYANGSFAPAPGASYGDSNVVSLLGTFGSNTVSTTGNVTSGNLRTGGNIVFTANTSQVVFNTTAFISGNANSLTRDGSILLQPYTGAGSTFPGVIIGGAGRLLAPNGSVHQIFNASDVTFQVAAKVIAGTAATSTTTGALQITGGGGFTTNVYVGGSLVRTGAISQTAWTTSGIGLRIPTSTYTDNSTSAGTQAASYVNLMDAPTLAFANAVTVTNATTLFVAAPTAGTNATITNAYAVVANGAVSISGNVTTAGNFVGNGASLTNVVTKVTGSWTVTTGTNTYSFTVPTSGTYQLWVECNIANGILSYNATATVTNSNVPVVGQQFAWVYNGGGTPVDFTSIPNQFIGTGNTIVRSSVASSATTNRFDFGINNTSGGNVTASYGYAKIS